MINKILYGVAILLVLSGVLSCRKTPGQGGNATIKGRIWVKKYDPYFSILELQYPGDNMAVSLTFGNNTSPDMSAVTNANGEFEFLYLRKGNYKVTIYSKVFQDSLHPSGEIPVDANVTIDKRKGTYDVGTLTVQRN